MEPSALLGSHAPEPVADGLLFKRACSGPVCSGLPVLFTLIELLIMFLSGILPPETPTGTNVVQLQVVGVVVVGFSVVVVDSVVDVVVVGFLVVVVALVVDVVVVGFLVVVVDSVVDVVVVGFSVVVVGLSGRCSGCGLLGGCCRFSG